jgi:geranylgeranyl reductase family protein
MPRLEAGVEGMFDVLIIGGGPVGCYTASLLAKKGFDTLVLERNPCVGHRVICAGLIGVEAFRRFRLPKGAVINQVGALTFFSPSGIRFSYRTDQPIAFMVDREAFDGDMADIALSAGAQLRCNSLVRNLRLRDYSVIVEVESPEGKYELQAKMGVVAGGFNPRLIQRLGLHGPAEWVQGAETEVEVDGLRETEIYVGRDIAPGSFAWVAPMGSGKAKIGMTTRRNADQYLRSFLDNPVIRDRMRSNVPEINVDLIPIRPIEKSFMERVLVVGEAAGQVKSTTGGGIYYGLISARWASETIGEAFSQGKFDESNLKRYERRWKRELRAELEIGYRFRQIFSRIEDRQINNLFEILNSDGISPLIHSMAQFDWHKDLILMLSKHVILRKYLHPISVFAKRFTE